MRWKRKDLAEAEKGSLEMWSKIWDGNFDLTLKF